MSILSACCSTDTQDGYLAARPFSLLERFAYVPVITRVAHTIVYLYQYPSATLPSTTFLQQRVADVQQEVHHLWSEVVDGETNRPSLQLRAEGPWPGGDIVRDDSYDVGTGAEADQKILLAREIARMRARVADVGPAWQVTRYQPSKSDSPSDSLDTDYQTPSYLMVSVYHHLVDGTGGLRLSLILLSDYPIIPAPGLAPRLEDLIPISPSIPFLLKEIYRELINPALPYCLQSIQTCWPGEKVNGSPADFPEAQAMLHLPADWIAALKAAGKANGVSTLHPIIETALTMALHEVMGSPEGFIDVSTPVNERIASDPIFPQFAGVIISGFHKLYSHLDLPPSHSFTDFKLPAVHPSFWPLAKSTAAHHSSSSAKRQGRYGIGSLAYLPDPKSFSSSHSENASRRTKTGWEDFFWSNIERPAPMRTSIAISNLGYLPALPPGCVGMQWSQSAAPFEDAMIASAIGHQDGMEASLAYRDGCAMSKGQAEETLSSFKEILGGLI